jgi:hypothetical protein
MASSTTGWPVSGINGTGTVVVVSGTVVGASVVATVVGATDVDVDSAESPPPPQAANAIPARVIEKAKRRFWEIFTVPLITQFVHQVVDEC